MGGEDWEATICFSHRLAKQDRGIAGKGTPYSGRARAGKGQRGRQAHYSSGAGRVSGKSSVGRVTRWGQRRARGGAAGCGGRRGAPALALLQFIYLSTYLRRSISPHDAVLPLRPPRLSASPPYAFLGHLGITAYHHPSCPAS